MAVHAVQRVGEARTKMRKVDPISLAVGDESANPRFVFSSDDCYYGLAELDRLSGPIAAIWFEEVRRHAGTDAAHVYGGLMATLTAWAEMRGVPYEGVPVGTIKRFATGKGNANKEAMIASVRARGFSPADDNEADAIAILFWALETKGGMQ